MDGLPARLGKHIEIYMQVSMTQNLFPNTLEKLTDLIFLRRLIVYSILQAVYPNIITQSWNLLKVFSIFLKDFIKT
jgi:hypothetical protein